MHVIRPSTAAGLMTAALLTPAVAGCTPDADAPDGDPTAGGATSAGAQASVTEDEQGQGQLPDNFPAEFPLPADFTVTSGNFTEGDAMTQANFLVRGTSAQSVAEVASFYHERLPEAGYEVQRW